MNSKPQYSPRENFQKHPAPPRSNRGRSPKNGMANSSRIAANQPTSNSLNEKSESLENQVQNVLSTARSKLTDLNMDLELL